MKLFIKNKVISLGGGSEVVNENQEVVYRVDGKVFSFTDKKFIYDANNNLVYIVRNKFWKFFVPSAYVYDSNKNKLCKIKSKFWSPSYTVLGASDEITFDGKPFTGTCKIMKNGELIGELKNEFSIIADSYSLEADEKDMPFMVALVIAIDNMRDRRRKD